MDCGNKVLNTIVLLIMGLFGAASMIICVSLAVRAGLAPVGGALREVVTLQREMNQKLSVAGDMVQLSARVVSLENELRMMKQRGGAPSGGGQGDAPAGPPPEDFSKVYDLSVGGSYIFGKADAAITIVEFSDFQCPFCSRFHPLIKEVVQAFPNDVKLVLKNYPLPFHPNALPAAKAALAAGLQGKYYEMADLLMGNSKDLSDEKYKELAAKAGLNVEQFSRDLKEKDADFEKKIEADMELAQRADVRGTPSYFINGRKSRSHDVNAWKAEIQALLKK